MRIILFQPQIPQNAGNIVRTCAVTGSSLTLIRPLGFQTDDRSLKRAGLDYWEGVSVEILDDLYSLLESNPEQRFFFFSSKASRSYHEVSYQKHDWLIFGSETQGLPEEFYRRWPERSLTIPMLPSQRCLNLSNAVAIAIYEAWRQQDFV